MTQKPHVVLCLSGHDPTGGAGVQADIETVSALGAHAVTVITAYTVQDTRNVRRVEGPPPAVFRAQLEVLLADCDIHAIKIGLLAEAWQVPVIAAVIRRARVPVVLDPVLRAGGGKSLAGRALVNAMKARLLPLARVITPNAAEARRLAGVRGLDACGRALLKAGAANVLITGGDERTREVTNTWHARGQPPQRWTWPRVRGAFHGAGCTLAAAIATRLAQGHEVAFALTDGQAYAQAALGHARAVGRGRRIPRRVTA